MTFFGPVSNAATESNPMFGIVISVAIVVMCIALFTSSLLRDRAIRRGVEERGWQWIGESLPYYFPEHELIESAADLRIDNAFAGVIREVEFISCDCILGQGRHRTYISLVGVRSPSDPFGVTKFDNAYVTTHVGEWFGLTLSGNGWSGSRVMSAQLIFAIVENIG